MTALRCLLPIILIVSLPYIAMIGGWIADQVTAQKRLPTKRGLEAELDARLDEYIAEHYAKSE